MTRHEALLGFSVVILLHTTSCQGRKVRYDDLDLGPSKVDMKCGAGIAGDRREACRILDEFAAGDRFSMWPAKGLETWYGRKVCSDSIDASDRMDIARVHLMPGPGKSLLPADVPVDTGRIVPYGAQFIAMSISSSTPPILQGYRLLIDAAAAGKEPQLDALPNPADRDLVKRAWDDSKRPPGTTDFWQLVTSEGPSIRGNAYTTDTEKGPSASYFVRGKANKMLVVWPSNDPKVPTCVGEAWRIYVTP